MRNSLESSHVLWDRYRQSQVLFKLSSSLIKDSLYPTEFLFLTVLQENVIFRSPPSFWNNVVQMKRQTGFRARQLQVKIWGSPKFCDLGKICLTSLGLSFLLCMWGYYTLPYEQPESRGLQSLFITLLLGSTIFSGHTTQRMLFIPKLSQSWIISPPNVWLYLVKLGASGLIR